MDVKELESTLTAYRGQIEQSMAGVKAEIDKAVAAQSDAANKAIADVLQPKMKELEEGLAAVQKQLADTKTLGLPGAEETIAKKWSWSDFFRGMMNVSAAGRGSIPPEAAGDPWKHAPEVRELCVEYGKRAAKRDSVTVNEKTGTAYRTYTSADGSAGGFLVPDQVSSEYVDAVIAKMPIGQIPGVRKLTNLQGDLFIPKVTSRGTAYMLTENGKPTASTGAFGGCWLRPHKAGAFQKQSNRLLYQTRGVSDAIIMDNIRKTMALKFHDQIINGTGADSEVKGLLQYSSSMTTTGISPTNGRRFLVDDCQKMLTALEEVDELNDMSSAAFLMRPIVKRGMIRERTIMYSGATAAAGLPSYGSPFPNDPTLAALCGAPVYTTTQLAATDTKGTSSTSSKVLGGDWSLVAIGTWRDPVFKVSDVAGDGSTGSAFLEDQFYMVSFMEFDVALLRETGFSLFEGAETTESSW